MNDDHDNDSELKTLFKYRVPESRVRLLREIFVLLLLLCGFSLGMVALACAQYYLVCTAGGREMSVMQCLRADYVKGKR